MPSKFNNLLGIFISEEISGAAASPPLLTPPLPSLPKIPPGIDGIQVNFCKNPTCAPPGLKKGVHRSKATASATGTEYRLVGKSRSGGISTVSGLLCLLCQESLPLKSNLGVAQEVARLSAYLWKKRGASCPNPACLNHGVSSRQSPLLGLWPF